MDENLNTLLNWNNLITYHKVENSLNAPLLEKMKDKKNILSKPNYGFSPYFYYWWFIPGIQ